jgi:hypothetical protein
MIDNHPVDEAKISRIEWNVDFAEGPDQPIVQLTGQTERDAVVAFSPNSIDDFVARLPMLQELGDKFRRILQIRVDLDSRLPSSMKKVGQNRELKTEITGKTQYANAGLVHCVLSQLDEGVIDTGIVGKKKLEFIPRIISSHLLEALDETVYVALFIQNGDRDCDETAFHG